MTEISLTSYIRSNLQNLRLINLQMDKTQNRLSTGLKVNSAIDNASNYYQARSLANRTADLQALLDSMGQGIQTIQTANEAIESAMTILQQAKAVTQKASENSVNVVARVHNEDELLAAVENGGAGYIIIENDISLTNQIKLKNGQKLVGDNYFAENNAPNRKLSFDFTGKIADAIIAGTNSIISNLDIDFATDSTVLNYGVLAVRGSKNVTISNINLIFDAPNITSGSHFGIIANGGAKVSLQGKINIQSASAQTVGIGIYGKSIIDNYADLNIATKFHGIKIGNGSTNEPNSTFNIHKGTTVNISAPTSTGIVVFAASSLYIDQATINIASQNTGIQNSEASTTIIANSKINIKSTSNCLSTSNSLTNIKNSELNMETENSSAFAIYSSANKSSLLNIDGNSRINIKTPNLSNGYAAFRITTYSAEVVSSLDIEKGAVININRNAPSDALWTFEENYHADQTQKPNEKLTLNLYINDFDTFTPKNAVETFPNSELTIPNIEDKLLETFSGYVTFKKETADNTSYNDIISQYNTLIKDASYQGINLLQNNNLKIALNETRTSQFEVKGVDASSDKVGILNSEWNTQMDILKSMEQVEKAINQLRSFASEFGNYYSIVTTRQTFTDALIDVLETGADNLTLADMNEESANYLALQTRQQLAINSLSLAAQSARSILMLF